MRGFSLANHTEDPIFDALSKSPELAGRFGNAVCLYTMPPGFDQGHLVKGYA